MSRSVGASPKQALGVSSINSILVGGNATERALQADSVARSANAAMQRYAAGDEPAFAEVYDCVAPRVHAFLARRLRDRSVVDDILQQTFLRMHSARGRFAQGAAVMPWAFAIARRLLIDRSRRYRGEDWLSEADDPALLAHLVSHESADELVHSKRLAADFSAAFARLPTRVRQAFELVNGDGLSIAEAAEVLGTTPSAVRLRIHRTYEALRAVHALTMAEEKP